MNHTLDKVKNQILKAQSIQIQIKQYNLKKRKTNSIFSCLLVVISGICALTVYMPVSKRWTFFSAIIVFFSTVIKEWKPFFTQPEKELEDLSKIQGFYRGYQNKLEMMFRKKIDINQNYSDKEMEEDLFKLLEEEQNKEIDMNKLCRGISKNHKQDADSEAYKNFCKDFRGC